MINNVTSSVELNHIMSEKDKTYNILFYCDWCPASKMLMTQLPNVDEFIKIDAEKNKELCDYYNIISVPTIVTIRNSKVSNRINGFKYRELIEKYLVEI